jgi:hypothetical protein
MGTSKNPNFFLVNYFCLFFLRGRIFILSPVFQSIQFSFFVNLLLFVSLWQWHLQCLQIIHSKLISLYYTDL